jgi:diadenosine tetraphosphate (Ap4A) HIT family hydrolase
VLPLTEYEHFADVPPEAATELFEILGRLEAVALGPLGADRINVVAAMMKDPFIHFHFFPRFENPLERFGQEWSDADWPRAITLRNVETPETILALVKAFYADRLDDAT